MMKRVALLLTVLAILPVLAYAGLTLAFRADAIDLGTLFGQLGWLVPALLAGGLCGVVAAVLMLTRRAFFPAATSLAVGLVAFGMAAGPLTMRRAADEVPFIHDVTTDTDDPPAFVAVLPLREGAPNPPEYDREQAAAQLAYYTDLRPLVVEKPYEEVFDLAVDAVRGEGLRVVAAVPSQGRIEAVATTAWFGFEDDVVLRLRDAHGIATVVDARSKSRIGGSDLGANAARLEAILGRIEGRTGG